MENINTKPIPVKVSEKVKCEGRGGVWDEATKTCKMPDKREEGTKIETQPTTPREKQIREKELQATSRFEAGQRVETEKQKKEAELDKPLFSGEIDTTPQPEPIEQEEQIDKGPHIEFLPDRTVNYTRAGQTINLTREEYDTFMGKAGMVTENVEAARALKPDPVAEAQAEAQVLAEEAGRLDFQQLQRQAEIANISYIGAFIKSIPDMIPDIAEAIGGAALAIGSGGALSGVGLVGVVDGVRGAYGDVIREVESQKGEFSGTQEQNLEEGKQVLNDIISARNAGATTKTKAAKSWNAQITKLYQSYYNIQRQHINNNFIGEDLTQEIAEFETYFSGEFLQQEEEFGLSLQAPDPARIEVTPEMRKRILKKIRVSR